MNNPSVLLVMNGWRQAARGLILKRRALRRGLTLGLAASLWLAVVPSVQAAGSSIDVNQPTSNGVYPLTKVTAQTFTAGTSGTLDQVRLRLSSGSSSNGTVEIRNVDATSLQPIGLALGPAVDTVGWTSTTPGTFISPYFVFSFNSPIPITSGKQYAIVVRLTAGTRSWAGENSSVYPGGQSWLGCNGCPAPWLPTTFPADFSFQTYATGSTSTNSAPIIKANTDPVLATEGGTAPTNTGTCSDPDGDTVTLRASAGNVTPTCNGTWSWTGSAADEGTLAITITADDGHGNTTPATFSSQVGSVSPKVTISGAPVSTPEGTTLVLTASATSPSAQDTAFTYAWTATEYGNALPGGIGASYSLKSDDEGVYAVTVTATDDGGFSGSASATITGVDVKPTATIKSVSQPFLIVPQQSLTFVGDYADAGSSVDTSYTATWLWGDNSPNTTGDLTNLTATHAYSASGTFTVTLTVADDDGVAGSTTTTVTVMTPALAIAKIETTVQGESGLNNGQKNSLLAKLRAAGDSYQRGNTGAACNQMNAFVNEVDADQKTGKLSSTDAGTLSDAARVTQRSMGCFSTLVEFLNGL